MNLDVIEDQVSVLTARCEALSLQEVAMLEDVSVAFQAMQPSCLEEKIDGRTIIVLSSHLLIAEQRRWLFAVLGFPREYALCGGLNSILESRWNLAILLYGSEV